MCFCFSFYDNRSSMGWICRHGNKYPLRKRGTHKIATLFHDDVSKIQDGD